MSHPARVRDLSAQQLAAPFAKHGQKKAHSFLATLKNSFPKKFLPKKVTCSWFFRYYFLN